MEHTIRITDTNFAPNELDVRHDDVITVINETGENHTLTSNDGMFDTDVIGPGEEIALEITNDVHMGANPFHCSFHNEMTGILVVSPSERNAE